MDKVPKIAGSVGLGVWETNQTLQQYGNSVTHIWIDYYFWLVYVLFSGKAKLVFFRVMDVLINP